MHKMGQMGLRAVSASETLAGSYACRAAQLYTHARTNARTHARTHTHTQSSLCSRQQLWPTPHLKAHRRVTASLPGCLALPSPEHPQAGSPATGRSCSEYVGCKTLGCLQSWRHVHSCGDNEQDSKALKNNALLGSSAARQMSACSAGSMQAGAGSDRVSAAASSRQAAPHLARLQEG